MRTQTKIYNIYNYNDLLQNEELKQKVLEKQAYINIDFEDWHRFIIYDTIKANDYEFYENGDIAPC